jgi:invasion protein IalB
MKRTLILFASLAAYLVFGGRTAAVAANDPRALQLTYEPWIKFCFDKAKCVVGAGAKGACFPSGGAVSIASDDKNASLSVYLGTKRVLEGAISVQVDQEASILVPQQECHALGCGGTLKVDSGFIERLKRSQTITLTATDTTHQKLSLSLSLADFAKAYDGPESDPPKVTMEVLGNEKFKELEQRREEEQKKLQCQE